MKPPAIWKGKSSLKGVVVFEPMAFIRTHRAIMTSCAALLFLNNDESGQFRKFVSTTSMTTWNSVLVKTSGIPVCWLGYLGLQNFSLELSAGRCVPCPYFHCRNQRYKGLPVLTNSNHWWCYERNLPNHFHEEMNKGMMMAFGAIRAAECVKGQWDVVMTLCNSAWLMGVGYSGWMRCRFIDRRKASTPSKVKDYTCSVFILSLIIDHLRSWTLANTTDHGLSSNSQWPNLKDQQTLGESSHISWGFNASGILISRANMICLLELGSFGLFLLMF